MIMRIKMMYIIGLLIVLTSLFMIETVYSIGVGQPMPVGFKLLRNDQGRFLFYIFGVGSSNKLSCSYSVSGLEPLIITFDNEKVIVEPEGQKIVRGTISVPANAPIRGYQGNLQVNCEPIVEITESTGSVIKRLAIVPFEVNVVEKLEGETPVMPEEEKPTTISTSAIFAIIIIVILVIGVGYYFGKKGKKKK